MPASSAWRGSWRPTTRCSGTRRHGGIGFTRSGDGLVVRFGSVRPSRVWGESGMALSRRATIVLATGTAALVTVAGVWLVLGTGGSPSTTSGQALSEVTSQTTTAVTTTSTTTAAPTTTVAPTTVVTTTRP